MRDSERQRETAKDSKRQQTLLQAENFFANQTLSSPRHFCSLKHFCQSNTFATQTLPPAEPFCLSNTFAFLTLCPLNIFDNQTILPGPDTNTTEHFCHPDAYAFLTFLPIQHLCLLNFFCQSSTFVTQTLMSTEHFAIIIFAIQTILPLNIFHQSNTFATQTLIQTEHFCQ